MSLRPVVAIVRSSVGNIASVAAGFERAGAEPVLVDTPEAVRDAERLVVPGVGSFGAMMAQLERLGLVGVLRERLQAGRSTIGMCLGLQVLFEASEESPGVAGLGVIPGMVRRFDGSGGLRVPQFGWNLVSPEPGAAVITDAGEGYFANSYRVASAAQEPGVPGSDSPGSGSLGSDGPGITAIRAAGWRVATAVHGGRFVAAVERRTQRGVVAATQFHPELSGPWGRELLARWVRATQREQGQALAVGEAGAASTVATVSDAREIGGEALNSADGSATGVLPRVIPCLDVRDGRVVKGVRFQGLRDAGDPVERAALYEQQGADELVILDVSATPDGRAHATDTVRAVRRAIGIPLTVGGGVRTPDDAERLLAAGADKVGINTAAVERPELIDRIAERFGVQCTILACDAARRADGTGWEVVTRSGTSRTGIDAVAWCREAARRGAGEILLTSWDRDGTGEGFDLELLAAVRAAAEVPIIASGGAKTPTDMGRALEVVDACLAASMFHDGHHTVIGVKSEIRERFGMRLRGSGAPAGIAAAAEGATT